MLENIKKANDIKKLTNSQLTDLTSEIRDEIIKVVKNNGGHLGSSLGAVELIVALHKVFDTPKDKIIFDVGHQAYAHKLLTGRYHPFKTLRTYRGLSGFTNRFESKYDHFTAGHAGPSISLALGVKEGIKDKKNDQNVIAVIGDGSFTSGISFEAINCAGVMKNGIKVVLNDNKMSIDKNVGAMSQWFSKTITGSPYHTLRSIIKPFLKSKGKAGEKFLTFAHKLAETARVLFTPGLLFEGLGFRYVGPIDGHNITELIDTFEAIKDVKEPVLIHVITQKGKGYQPSEDDPLKYHGVSPKNGAKKGVSWTSIFSDTLVDIAKDDKDIIAITAAMPQGTGLDKFQQKYPDRYYDVGIAEQHAVAFGAGLANEGRSPFVAIYSTFLQRSLDQIFHEVDLQNLPIKLIVDRAGIVGEDGATHQGVFDISYLRIFPNIVIMAPSNDQELKNMVYTASKYSSGPIAIRFPRGEVNYSDEKNSGYKLLDIGKFTEKENLGDQFALLPLGWCSKIGEQLFEMLKKEGYKGRLIDPRFIKPLDNKMLKDIFKNCDKIITIEENVLSGGFGSSIFEWGAKNSYYKPILPIALPDSYIEHGTQNELRKLSGLSSKQIFKKVKKFLN